MFFKIGDICSNINNLERVYFIKNLFKLCFIIIPLILIFLFLFDMVKMRNKNDSKGSIKKIIFMVIIMLVPFIFNFINNKLNIISCYNINSNNVKEVVTRIEHECYDRKGYYWDSDLGRCIKEKSDVLREDDDVSIDRKMSASNSIKRSISIKDNPVNQKYPIAEAGLMLALPNRYVASLGYGSDLYVYLYDQVLKSTERKDDYLYRTGKKGENNNSLSGYRMSSVAASVIIRFSGCDDNFPLSSKEQLGYVKKSKKWKSVNYNDLLPGDVFIDNDYTMIYVGEKLMHEYFKNAPDNYNVVSASFNKDYFYKSLTPHISYRSDLNSSRWKRNVFRCVVREKKSKYANIEIPSSVMAVVKK